jgi:hypothetical protein
MLIHSATYRKSMALPFSVKVIRLQARLGSEERPEGIRGWRMLLDLHYAHISSTVKPPRACLGSLSRSLPFFIRVHGYPIVSRDLSHSSAEYL